MYLLQGALDATSLYPSESSPAISGEALEILFGRYRAVAKMIDRMARVYPKGVMGQLLYTPKLALEAMKNELEVGLWCEKLQAVLDATQESGSEVYQVGSELDREHSLFVPVVDVLLHGISTRYRLDVDFFRSRDYQELASLGSELQSLLEDGAFLQRGEKRFELHDLGDGIQWLMDLSRRGSAIQRYKGLGEMNPIQLWETTMDPDARRMLRVTIEDAISADQLFTTLMGDDVEPRRNFIEANALNVANLDI